MASDERINLRMVAGRLLRIGFEDALFVLKSNKLPIFGMTFFIVVYVPLMLRNALENIRGAGIPLEAAKPVVETLILIDNVVAGLMLATAITSLVDRERLEHILEYLIAYSTLDARGFISVKILSAIILAVPLISCYTIGVITVVLKYGVADLILVLNTYLSAILLAIAETAGMLILSLTLHPRYSSTIKFMFMIVVLMLLYQLTKISVDMKLWLEEPLMLSYILASIIFVLVLITYKLRANVLIESAIK